MASTGLKRKYPWNDVNRLQLVEAVKAVTSEGISHGLKWKEVSRRLPNESDLDDSLFAKLCSKQYDNLYRAYKKFEEGGDVAPPRLTARVIEEFHEVSRGSPTGSQALDGDMREVVLDTKSSGPNVDVGLERRYRYSKLIVPEWNWTNGRRLNLLDGIRVGATGEGKIRWTEVIACMCGEVPEQHFSSICMKEFTDLCNRFKRFKECGLQQELTLEIIQSLEELYVQFPNLNPFPGGENTCALGQDRIVDEMIMPLPELGLYEDEMDFLAGSIDVPSFTFAGRISDNLDVVRQSFPVELDNIGRGSFPLSSSVGNETLVGSDNPVRIPSENDPPTGSMPNDVAIGSSSRGQSTRDVGTRTPSNKTERLGKRKQHPGMSSCDGDLPIYDEEKDVLEVGFERIEKELLSLKPWMKHEVVRIGREVLCGVKEVVHERKPESAKRWKSGPQADFENLIAHATRKSITHNIKAQFQQSRANISREIHQTIERLALDLLNR